MPPVAPRESLNDFLGLRPDEVTERVQRLGWPAFRADQVLKWVYQRCVVDTAEMTNLSRSDRETLASLFRFSTAELAVRRDSDDGTVKLLLSFPGGASAETVMIPDGKSVDGRRQSPERRTVCVSSQVGCPVGCRFCASGMNGLSGSLSAARIVEQVLAVNRLLLPRRERTTHVVFMGMGEPLANYSAVLRAVRILHDPKAFNISARKITISTVGVPTRIRQLAGEDLPLNLALSLHAPNEPLRRQLIPWADHFSLDDILDACRFYFEKTGREITFEYILLAGVNDRPEHAKQLASLCKTLRANVNLLRYNEVDGTPYKRPATEATLRFQQVLRQQGINAHVRRSRGRDIDAACGQLRRKEERRLELLQLGNQR
jgi:23S rRNA (adenine2503-C2)-methyltransferase